MNFIIIETFGGPAYAIIVTDENGNNLVFSTRAKAEEEAKDCQQPVILEI